MIPNPIHKVLSTLCTHELQYLLMGGQACVFYGAAEFSRDCDVVIVCDPPNLARLQSALVELAAEPIAVPPFELKYLERGHAVHFRCQSPDAKGIRLDVMARLRGVDSFEELWARRTTLEDQAGVRIELVALPDLVAAKKTQRDKDWPMLRRLVEAHYEQHRASLNEQQVRFWLRQSRTPEMLRNLVSRFPEIALEMTSERPLLRDILSADPSQLESAFNQEEQLERDADRRYWKPLKAELESLRRNRKPSN